MISYLLVLLVAVVWGYFADLKNGQIGWFIGRIFFMVGIAALTGLGITK